MNTFYAALFGLVEGLTEFLPVSSTAHLMLTTDILRRALGADPSKNHETFEIVIQLGAILAVVVLYWRALFVEWRVTLRVAIAFFPTGLLGWLLHDVIKNDLLKSTPVALWSLALGGLFIIVFEWLHRDKPDDAATLSKISYGQAFIIGVCQALAMIPGVSRSAATVLGGLAVGVRRRTSVEFSFLLAVPTMVAASGYTMYKQYKEGGGLSPDEGQFLAVGFITSFIVAIVAIRFLLGFVKTHTFLPFGVYRILLVLAFVTALITGVLPK